MNMLGAPNSPNRRRGPCSVGEVLVEREGINTAVYCCPETEIHSTFINQQLVKEYY